MPNYMGRQKVIREFIFSCFWVEHVKEEARTFDRSLCWSGSSVASMCRCNVGQKSLVHQLLCQWIDLFQLTEKNLLDYFLTSSLTLFLRLFNSSSIEIRSCRRDLFSDAKEDDSAFKTYFEFLFCILFKNFRLSTWLDRDNN